MDDQVAIRRLFDYSNDDNNLLDSEEITVKVKSIKLAVLANYNFRNATWQSVCFGHLFF